MQNTEQAENERDRLLDGIIAQYYRLADAGEVTEQSDFILRNPEFASELRDFFSDARLLHSQDHGDPLESVPDGPLALDVSLPLSPPSGSFVRYFGEYEILEELGASGVAIIGRGLIAGPGAARYGGGLCCSVLVRSGQLAPRDGTDGRNPDAIEPTGPAGISAVAPNQAPAPQARIDAPTLALEGRPPSSDPALNSDDLHCSRY